MTETEDEVAVADATLRLMGNTSLKSLREAVASHEGEISLLKARVMCLEGTVRTLTQALRDAYSTFGRLP